MGLENPVHLAILALIILLVFGAKRLPEIGRSLGTGMREFKGAITGSGHDDAEEKAAAPVVEPAKPAVTTPPAEPAPPPSDPAGTPDTQ